VFLNRRAAARYRALASIIPGRERPDETTICYKISLVQMITNLNIILYLSTCHTVYISVLILFMIMPLLIITIYVSLMYELTKKIGKVFANKFVGTGRGPRLMKKNLPGRGLTKVEKHRCTVSRKMQAVLSSFPNSNQATAQYVLEMRRYRLLPHLSLLKRKLHFSIRNKLVQAITPPIWILKYPQFRSRTGPRLPWGSCGFP
jgi:hypothetical protein